MKIVIKANKRYEIFLLLLVAAIAIFITFFSALDHFFLNWDDNIYVTENPLIKDLSWQNTKEIFSSFVSGNYHPIPLLSYSLEYHFIKSDPFYYHLNNLTLHIINFLLVYFLIYKLDNNIFTAFFTALLFAIHPLKVEPVAWISSRKDLFYGLFIICSMLFYLNYSQKKRLEFYLLSIVFFILSLLSKAMALAFPFVLLLFDFYSGRKITKKEILEKIPFIVVAILFGIIALFARESYVSVLHENEFTFSDSIFLGTYRIIFYYFLRTFLLGNVDWIFPYPHIEYPSFYLIFSSIVITISLFIIVLFSLKKTKRIAFGLCFFFLFIAPVLKTPILGFTADRFSYIPSIGISFLVANFFSYLINKIPKANYISKLLTFLPLLSIILFCFYTSWHKTKFWKSDTILWGYLLKHYPNFYMPYYQRGMAYMSDKEIDLAVNDFNKAQLLNPNYAEIYHYRGNAFMLQGKYNLAINDFNSALKLNPKLIVTYNNLGEAYYNLGILEKACQSFNKSCDLGNCVNLEWAQSKNICK